LLESWGHVILAEMQQGQSEKIKILLYEESAAAAVLVRTAIDECGSNSEVTPTASHADAENLLASEHFHLLMTNFGADHAEASRFIRSVRANHPRLLIVVLSNIRDSGEAYEAGAHVFLRKSSEWRDYVRTIEAMLDFWLEIAELPSVEYSNRKIPA
jgi:DNA-binding NarL/FixJ family response regulator